MKKAEAFLFIKKKILIFAAIISFLIIGIAFLNFRVKNKEEEQFWKTIPFDMKKPQLPAIADKNCEITKYGAISGGKTKNTQAFSSAIEDCAGSGGGKIIVPAGKWLTGPIHFKSNIELVVEKGAEIVFSDDPNDYLPVVFTRFEGMELYNYSPFIYAKDCENVAITGEGVLNGQGEKWQEKINKQGHAVRKLYRMASQGVPVEERIFGANEAGLRSSFIEFISCNKALIENVTIKDSPFWTVHPLYSDNVTIRKIRVMTNNRNSDGVVVDSSTNTLVEDSYFETGDDAISIKSGRNEDGLRVNKPSENVIIRNCRVEQGHSAFSIGSEISANVKNILIDHCQFRNTDWGIRIKSEMGRNGTVEDIWAKNIFFQNIGEAITLDTNYKGYGKPANQETSLFQRMHFENLTGRNVKDAIVYRESDDQHIKSIDYANLKINDDNKITIINVDK